MKPLSLVFLVAAPLGAQDTAPRRLIPIPVAINAAPATISGVRELHDGRLLVSDAKNAGVYLVDPAKRQTTVVGSIGGDELQYAQPGGFYAGAGDSTLLLDRGLTKALVITPAGAIVGARSIKRNGVTGSSTDDVDHQRLDARGLAYFEMRGFPGASRGAKADSIAVARFDAARQHYDTVAKLRAPEEKTVQVDEHVTLSQFVNGSPGDGWGVAPDGRVAVVRAVPYRVDWISPDGRVVRGKTYGVSPIPFTAAEKDSIVAPSRGHGGGSVGIVGGSTTSASDAKHYFADVKAPFATTDIIVSPRAQVWVSRTQPFHAPGTTYDVFDEHGDRIDRVFLPEHARVIGFGAGAVYAVARDADGKASLLKYKL